MQTLQDHLLRATLASTYQIGHQVFHPLCARLTDMSHILLTIDQNQHLGSIDRL